MKRKKYRVLPSQEELRCRFDYDKENGILTWKISTNNRIKVGQEAGTLCGEYKNVNINGITYRIHRVIWKWMTGVDPRLNVVDHKNRNKLDNRWKNLRLSNQSGNMCNSENKRNKTGYRGVSWDKGRNKFTAHICVNGKDKNLGRFDTAELAALEYNKFALLLHGEFANFNKVDETSNS